MAAVANPPVAINDDIATTISVQDVYEERDPSFLPTDFGYIPERDLLMTTKLLFEHLANIKVRNPMALSRDVDLPSFKDILLDLLSSKHSWCDAIEKQKMIAGRNKNYLADLVNIRSRMIANHIRHDTLTEDISRNENDVPPRTYRVAMANTRHMRFLSRFTEENSELLEIHEGDADEPFDIFQVKLPVWFNSPGGGLHIRWVSLYTVLTSILFNDHDKAQPTLPPQESFSCTHYFAKLFSNNTIANRTPTQHFQFSHSLPNIMHRIRSHVKFGTSHQNGIFLRETMVTQYRTIGKARYTLSVILRWIELTHASLFRDQISHSIMYHFYRNVHIVPTMIRSGGTEKRYVNASLRTLTQENMPDEDDDPVLLIPFEEGQQVYKMNCCKKDLSMGAILGIIQSGRTLMCPMCRARLFTTNDECPIDPTYVPPVITQVVDNYHSYMVNPRIPPELYAQNPITLE